MKFPQRSHEMPQRYYQLKTHGTFWYNFGTILILFALAIVLGVSSWLILSVNNISLF